VGTFINVEISLFIIYDVVDVDVEEQQVTSNGEIISLKETNIRTILL